jgi:hypothetical protein
VKQIIEVAGQLYLVKGKQSVPDSDVKGTNYWKQRWNADIVLRNNNEYYFCQNILEAEFEDI